ncbi:polyphosphate kinase 2 family protein [Prosthecochloris sp. N3]|uniref:Polyphosphate kinase 2 family protein n=1 Tax=Prosthecochloris ethylica TaxID=2743976 RepID=A0ABR9XPQ9_9CHLB|nr:MULTISPECIES: ADP-polyphosphate phosphotransferase [Prosthecochloris]MBF0586122.1 polyphosphate kinase 2 family protein [Prosthecochloris ethylica]MBF0635828.1 polyphosphate kinase 2 family protein [Prosthecochloris ethylica]NUK47496.1 polyphosphate kinase 2 family protein [Prosthecochloris ethylica]RNA65038.1 polyphosphate kinase 2 family protein [Prosthecochloris sp. ZM_2]
MKSIHQETFRVGEGEKVDLSKRPTRIERVYGSKEQYKEMLKAHVDELKDLQQVHYADDRYSVLLIFQAMDAAGKDSAIKHVMSGVNPQGCQVYSFSHPSQRELDHDFLWRAGCWLPERGRIGIFNRSYYEEVLIVRVHPEILQSQKIPEDLLNGRDVWKSRFESINSMERHLHHNGTRIVKFFLHLSKEEQRKRFLARIDNPEKNWKFSIADIRERQYWDDYMHAYEECLTHTSTRRAPWYIVPADDKKNARLIVSQIILDTFRSLDLSYPETSPERREELLRIREMLASGESYS